MRSPDRLSEDRQRQMTTMSLGTWHTLDASPQP